MEVKDIKDSSLAQNPVIGQMLVNNHEQILFCNDNATGLKAIIAIHNTVLGPSLGGTRMWNYNNEMEAFDRCFTFVSWHDLQILCSRFKFRWW